MKILVLGANGQFGWELCRKGEKQSFDILAFDLPELDITDHSSVKKRVNQSGVSLVINAAAYTAVDKAESEPELVFAVNRDGPANIASSCAEAGIPLIHVSTDYVFDGNKKGPYFETDPVSPLGVYGKSKATGETKIREHLQEYIILRTAWLYGLHGNNFVKTMIRLGREKRSLRVVADQYGCPTFAADLAEAILAIATQIGEGRDIKWGTYHYCGEGVTTWYGFTQRIFELVGKYISLKVKRVEPISTAKYPTPAKRPANSALDCSMITRHFDITPRSWQEGLADMINRVLSFS